MIEARAVGNKTSYLASSKASSHLLCQRLHFRPCTLAGTRSAHPHYLVPYSRLLLHHSNTSHSRARCLRRRFSRLPNLAMFSGVIPTHVIDLPSEPLLVSGSRL